MNNRNTSCRAVCEENNNNKKKKCSNDNHRPTRGSASFWPRETEPRVLANGERRTNISTAAGMIFCFFLIFAERAQHRLRRVPKSWRCLLLIRHASASTRRRCRITNEREDSRGSGFATGAESASSVAKRFCTGLNNDA